MASVSIDGDQGTDDRAPWPAECAPRPMAVKDLLCGDMIHQVTWLGVEHWWTWGPARPSWPVPGKWHVTKDGCGTHAVYASQDDVVLVCGTVKCSTLCAYEHRDIEGTDHR